MHLALSAPLNALHAFLSRSMTAHDASKGEDRAVSTTTTTRVARQCAIQTNNVYDTVTLPINSVDDLATHGLMPSTKRNNLSQAVEFFRCAAVRTIGWVGNAFHRADQQASSDGVELC